MKTLHNSQLFENKCINCDNKLSRSRKKIILKPIKTNIPFSAKKIFTMETNSKEEPLIVKEDDKIMKNNNYINYLKNIKEFNSKNKYYSLNYSKSNNSLISSNNKDKSPIKINISDKNSSIHKEERHKNSQYIKLNSLFNLPPIDNINRYNSFKSINNSNSNNEVDEDDNQIKYNQLRKKSKIRNYHKKIRLNLFNNEQLSKIKMRNRTEKKLEDSKFDNLSNFMKFKYYEDVNEKMERKLREDYFIDRGVKDKIIDMGKIGIFWKNVLDYCSPLLYAEKYKIMQKYEKKDEENTLNNSKNNNKYNQKLYTSILRAKLIHFKKK